jgi:hypothetical protein
MSHDLHANAANASHSTAVERVCALLSGSGPLRAQLARSIRAAASWPRLREFMRLSVQRDYADDEPERAFRLAVLDTMLR